MQNEKDQRQKTEKEKEIQKIKQWNEKMRKNMQKGRKILSKKQD